MSIFDSIEPDRDAVELAPFINTRYPLGESFLQEYWKHIEVSEPKEDLDSRLLIYLIRHQVCLSSLYPKQAELRDQ